jgi:hypothetical protein
MAASNPRSVLPLGPRSHVTSLKGRGLGLRAGLVELPRAWTVRIFAYDGRGSWSERLRAVEQVPGQTWTGVDVVAATLSPGGSTLIAMATSQGTGVYLGYDLVRWPGSTGRPAVAAHRGDLSHGFFRVRRTPDGTVLDDYGADYDDGAPNCCPNRYDHARIAFRDGVFRYLVRERLPASAVGR